MKLVIVAALGLCLALYLVAYVGFGAVVSAAVAVGWGGFALLCLYGLAQFPLLGCAWHVLLPAPRARIWIFVWGRMVREAATDVLPFSQLGGIVLGARAAIGAWRTCAVGVRLDHRRCDHRAAGADRLHRARPRDLGRTCSAEPLRSVARPGSRWSGSCWRLPRARVFLALQRFGHRLTLRLAQRLLPRAVASTAAVGEELDRIYASRPRVAASAAIHLLGWIAGAVGSWIAFRLIGVRIDLASVIAIESLVSAAKSAAVIVPNALGVQEATYAALAPVFGVGAPFGLALSLLKRARDLALAVPILAGLACDGRTAGARQA